MADDYIKHLRQLDSLSLDRLMSYYGQDVWNYAYMITKRRELSDDIAQDVFLQAYRHAASFRGESSAKTWLLRITRNISYNYLRSAVWRRMILTTTFQSKDSGPSAEQLYLEQEAANEVWAAVFKLPVKFREVMLLYARHQLEVKEIAAILGLSVGTVKSRLWRARARISAQLAKEATLHGQ
ncbi:RNA polymerase sigma factor [Paenibacillus sp. GCM10023252]|uniref:RNA polymerase sigma factor n=1 Tax=Paenibacillus sp. GCM10023252 TaxID=3252649 RepID=UPI00360A272F